MFYKKRAYIKPNYRRKHLTDGQNKKERIKSLPKNIQMKQSKIMRLMVI